MNLLRRLFRRLFPPTCAECGGYYAGGMIGSYWHKESCSTNRRDRQEGSDEE